MFEAKDDPLLSRRDFLLRMLRFVGAAISLVLVALLVGVLGYRLTEGMSWINALLNASMILAGMGPVDQLHTQGGKLFASAYALFSGVVFLVVAGVLFAPLFHRLLHRFHLEDDDEPPGQD
jgi:hypothetical protein